MRIYCKSFSGMQAGRNVTIPSFFESLHNRTIAG